MNFLCLNTALMLQFYVIFIGTTNRICESLGHHHIEIIAAIFNCRHSLLLWFTNCSFLSYCCYIPGQFLSPLLLFFLLFEHFKVHNSHRTPWSRVTSIYTDFLAMIERVFRYLREYLINITDLRGGMHSSRLSIYVLRNSSNIRDNAFFDGHSIETLLSPGILLEKTIRLGRPLVLCYGVQGSQLELMIPLFAICLLYMLF